MNKSFVIKEQHEKNGKVVYESTRSFDRYEDLPWGKMTDKEFHTIELRQWLSDIDKEVKAPWSKEQKHYTKLRKECSKRINVVQDMLNQLSTAYASISVRELEAMDTEKEKND